MGEDFLKTQFVLWDLWDWNNKTLHEKRVMEKISKDILKKKKKDKKKHIS